MEVIYLRDPRASETYLWRGYRSPVGGLGSLFNESTLKDKELEDFSGKIDDVAREIDRKMLAGQLEVEEQDELLDSGEMDLAWSFDIDNGNGLQVISVILNDEVYASVTEDLQPDWSGGNAAAFGGASTALAAGGGNTSLQARAFQSGTINVDTGLALTTADGRLSLDEVQPAGKRRMDGAAYRRGRRR